ncbi:hypothetical protein RHOSPDRAFT_36617 [Rhodotorula sp. JG-1b]|nr:hypothetical protein RHOSPDRAFT_36617 [Rhodotorula sp. JG-1b]
MSSARIHVCTLHTRHAEVCLRFRRPGDAYLELWTTSGLLATASHYYKTLLASGYAETVPSGSKRQRSEALPSIEYTPSGHGDLAQPTIDWQDSDDETDDFLVERDWSGCTTTKQDAADFDYQQMETGHIKFAPIRSSHALPPDELATKRKASLAKSLKKMPTLPPAVSPKSVYRLAHLLERYELQNLALDSFASSLTISGAANEIFSPASLAYDKLRKVVVDFVVKNWKEVEATEAWHASRAKVASGQTEGGAQILFDLFATIDDKT